MTDDFAAVPDGSAPRPHFRRILLLDMLLPFATVLALQRYGAAPLVAYAAASLFPVGSILSSWTGRRSVDFIGIGVLCGIACGLLLALVTHDPRFGLVKAAPAFAAFGIACLVSLPTRRPLMFFVARSFSASDAAETAAWNARLSFPRFLRVMRVLTAVWGAGTLTHAVLAIAAAFVLPAHIALLVEPMLAFTIIAALLAWTNAFRHRAASTVS